MSDEVKEVEQRRRLPLFTLFAASAISYVGDYLTLLAIPWFVLTTTGSIPKTGITAFFSTLPSVLSAFFGSILVDRLGYKRASVFSDLASGVSVALIPLLYHTAGLAFWQLLALVFLGGLFKSPGATARTSMVPELIEAAQMRMERANAINDGISRVSALVGAPLAGVLIAVIGTSNLLWLDGASFGLSALLMGMLIPSALVRTQIKEEGDSNYWSNLGSGLQFIRRDSLILAIVVTVSVTNLLDAAFFSVIEPAYIKQVFNSAIPLGLISAALGGAGFVGTILFGAIGHRLPRRLTFGIAFIIGGALRFWIFLVPILPLLILIHVVAGLAIGSINPLIDTIAFERIPKEMRARVFGVITAGAFVGVPLGTALSGYVATAIGLRASIIGIGAIYLLTTASLLVNPALKTMDVKV
jgi:MFS family permease